MEPSNTLHYNSIIFITLATWSHLHIYYNSKFIQKSKLSPSLPRCHGVVSFTHITSPGKGVFLRKLDKLDSGIILRLSITESACVELYQTNWGLRRLTVFMLLPAERSFTYVVWIAVLAFTSVSLWYLHSFIFIFHFDFCCC